MHADTIILVLFLALLVLSTVGLILYIRKAHRISSKTSLHMLVADIEQTARHKKENK